LVPRPRRQGVFGLRIYATGLGQSEEYQSFLQFGENGILTDQIATTWISAFRSALLFVLAVEKWRCGRALAIGINGLGRMGFAATFLLLQMLPVASLVVRSRKSLQQMRYLERLRAVSDLPIREIGTQGSAVDHALEIARDLDAAPVALYASSRTDRNPYPAVVSDPFLRHIASKYEGAWDGPSNILLRDCKIVTDSLGQMTPAREMLTARPEGASGLSEYLIEEIRNPPGRPLYYLSLGAPAPGDPFSPIRQRKS